MKTSVCIRLGLALIAVQAGLWLAEGSIALAQQRKAPALSEVIAKLASDDAKQQLKAVDEICSREASAAEAAPKLVELLSARSAELRWHAARALAAMGPKAAAAVPALAKSLSDADPLVRAHAAQALGQIGPASRDVVADLGKLIADPDVRVRRATVAAWRNIRPGPKVSIPIFVKVLEDAQGEVKVQAMLAISEAGREAVPALIEALKNDRARYWACIVLGDIGPHAAEAIPALVEQLKCEEPQVRMQATMALTAIGPSDSGTIAALIPLLRDSEYSVRYAATFAMTKIGPAAKDATPTLKKNLDDKDTFLVAISAWALARVNDKDAAALDVAISKLVPALKDKEQRTRLIAVKALFDLNPPSEKVAPALAEALRDSDPEVLANVIDALAAHGEAVVPRAIKALDNDKLRVPAIMLLRRLGPKAKDAVPALVAILKSDGSAPFRQEIIDALESIGMASEQSVPALVGLLSDDNLEVRRGATFALGKIGPAAKAALPAIRKNFDNDQELRPISIWAMVHIAPGDEKIADEAVPFMIAALKRQESVVRFHAAQTLGMIAPRAHDAIPALEAASKDPDLHVREAVTEALKKIKG
jgi:HEAT repeat protein